MHQYHLHFNKEVLWCLALYRTPDEIDEQEQLERGALKKKKKNIKYAWIPCAHLLFHQLSNFTFSFFFIRLVHCAMYMYLQCTCPSPSNDFPQFSKKKKKNACTHRSHSKSMHYVFSIHVQSYLHTGKTHYLLISAYTIQNIHTLTIHFIFFYERIDHWLTILTQGITTSTKNFT